LGFHFSPNFVPKPQQTQQEKKNNMIQELDIQKLIWLGLTEIQAKIYLTLLEMGEASTEKLSKQTKKPPSEVCLALSELKEIGIIQEGTTNIFRFKLKNSFA
jgi:predicted transcriptional regulator